VDDNGIGMDYKVLRKAVRLGVSDKNPKKDVGFMGIGIYSAYHLCEKLVIYSRKEGHSPYRLTMNFVGMKEELEEQRSLRLQEEINDDELTDLQTLLEKHIDITNEGDISHEEFPRFGTRVELHGIENAFYDEVANFEDTAEYLRLNVPLKFDRDKFKYAELIEQVKASPDPQDIQTYQFILKAFQQALESGDPAAIEQILQIAKDGLDKFAEKQSVPSEPPAFQEGGIYNSPLLSVRDQVNDEYEESLDDPVPALLKDTGIEPTYKIPEEEEVEKPKKPEIKKAEDLLPPAQEKIDKSGLGETGS